MGRDQADVGGGRLTDSRGVDRMTECVVPGCDTYVTRRRGICSGHWWRISPRLRGEIQEASRRGDLNGWMAAVRRAARSVAEEN